ncbi:MAG: DegT/DnrJ/EryC1/StrS family aminotransferase [Ignavibacterium sp.]|jgi:dTDP-4-amino-4,6-dideoxygalactose transaminase|nr:MAG: DegT/DnrJ/EryC1/StrS family aminotransferase [Ignavibacterium sp.]MDD5609759.1 DegT/DnrJ/EryC1/StrS family aminotransferase [Ignavibacterium sp.]MDX9711601.1 DegT/DnrJ/EryC1/StrS family aminotransferase [Ignavibacteriaceae bacterium]GIK22689.1 MAG: glutamine--scyllo-inositol aminotransferase [Ignavibacteriota bacterium]HMN16997.1 DegT/DnrJ/EryC1/StrS family aminotransferase [Ignavibacteriaceae bacterium]
MQVPLLDLKLQYKSLKKELDDAIIKVAESQHFILGPEVTSMEKEFCSYLGCKHSIGVSSGTDALLLALMAIDIKPGDEVIVPTYSFFATAGVVSRLFAVPVFVENDPVTFNIDPKDFERKITPKTKAVIPVHLYGQSADMDDIMEIAKAHNLIVIEDAAQAIGTQYKDGRFVGTIGDIGCFSFFPSKNLGCYGDGGLVTTNNDELAKILSIKRVHGGEPKYYHKVIGGNFRIDALQAAVLKVKLPHLDKWSEKRRQNANRYTQLFKEAGLAEQTGKTSFDSKNKVLLPRAVYDFGKVKNYHIYNQYIVRVEDRDKLREFLTKNEIGTEIYYPVPFHLQECFKELGYKKGDFPVSEFAADKSLALPIFPELSDDQLVYVVDTFKKFFNK